MISVSKPVPYLIGRRQFLSAAVKSMAAVGFAAGLTHCEIPVDPETSTRILVPKGFVPRIVGRSGYQSCAQSETLWHSAPDGGACFEAEDGGWLYLSNSEVGSAGGVGVLHFDANGTVVDSYRILSGTRKNCAGGKTPWNTWLSCEEVSTGLVWECDPYNIQKPFTRPALGVFKHESACVDPLTQQIYLTEDTSDSCLYRFSPADAQVNVRPDLSRGLLEVATIVNRRVVWVKIPDPEARTLPLRQQVKSSARFAGGEGIDIHNHLVHFTTKRDNRVWQLNLLNNRIEVIHELTDFINDVDDILHTALGEILIAEDGVGMRIIYLQQNSGQVLTFMQLPDHKPSEVTGLAFDPTGTRLYFSSQRGNTGSKRDGITFELFGDFRAMGHTTLGEWILDHRDYAF